MKNTVAIILILLGIVMSIWKGFSFTRKEKVLDAGPIEISEDREHNVNWPPYAGAVLIVAGVVVLTMSKRKT